MPLPHQLTNGTHAHLLPINLYFIIDANHKDYKVLIRISPGYPLVKGRLHTRYAPVRRSQNSKLFLPLDLHVLGLPLAFILSQDQTLHRIFFIFFDVSFKMCIATLLLFYSLLIQYVYELILFVLRLFF